MIQAPDFRVVMKNVIEDGDRGAFGNDSTAKENPFVLGHTSGRWHREDRVDAEILFHTAPKVW